MAVETSNIKNTGQSSQFKKIMKYRRYSLYFLSACLNLPLVILIVWRIFSGMSGYQLPGIIVIGGFFFALIYSLENLFINYLLIRRYGDDVRDAVKQETMLIRSQRLPSEKDIVTTRGERAGPVNQDLVDLCRNVSFSIASIGQVTGWVYFLTIRFVRLTKWEAYCILLSTSFLLFSLLRGYSTRFYVFLTLLLCVCFFFSAIVGFALSKMLNLPQDEAIMMVSFLGILVSFYWSFKLNGKKK